MFSGILKTINESLRAFFKRKTKRGEPVSEASFEVFPASCGEKGINLGHLRLDMSATFGTYFTGLLEQEHNYVNLAGQIALPPSVLIDQFGPLQSIYWALQQPDGPRILVLAAEGGMGKSTLAAKIICCLYEAKAADMILGDSAKTKKFDPLSGKVLELKANVYDSASFAERVTHQLGLNYTRVQAENKSALFGIMGSAKDQMVGRRAVVVLDNLETVEKDSVLLEAIKRLVSRDVRAIVTTRQTGGFKDLTGETLLVELNPIRSEADAHAFLAWHIENHVSQQPDLGKLRGDIVKGKLLQKLIVRTGGIPLAMQLVLSDIARSSWDMLDTIPNVFGVKLLEFLYSDRWDELGTLGVSGVQARELLRFISEEQYLGRKVTTKKVVSWLKEAHDAQSPQEVLRLLRERFMVVNHDLKQGDYALFPSLVDFVQAQNESKG